MALRYTKLQSTLKVDVVGEITVSGATDIKVIDLTALPYSQGVGQVMLVIQNAALTGDLTVVAKVNTATNGSGTDTTLQTMVLASANDEMVLEIPAELISDATDAAGSYAKSLVFDCSGTDTDTFDVAIVTVPLVAYDGLTPTDTTTVS